MIKSKSILAAVLMASVFAATPAVMAQDAGTSAAAPTTKTVVPVAPTPPAAAKTTAPAASSSNGTLPDTGTAQAPGAAATTDTSPANAMNANAADANAKPVAAASAATEPAKIPVKEIELQKWSFAGVFGKFDQNQLRRGFKVFKEVCSNCHSADLLSFRNLAEPGGPHFSVGQVKALAATYQIADASAKGGTRPGLASDRWPSPFATEQDARDANGGSLPPDFSVLAKARSVARPFPWWIFDFFTAYQEGGPDYIHALLTGFHDKAPAGFKLPPGKYYNDYFPGHSIGMPPPLSDGLVSYGKAADGSTVPETADQYSRDVAAFMMWVSDPSLDARKELGFRVIIFLLLLAGLMFAVKRKIWANAH